MDSTVLRAIITVCKGVIAFTYFGLLLTVVPRIDAASSLSNMRVIKSLLTVFFSLSIVTYIHIGYYIYGNFLPESYWNSGWYLSFVITHAVSGIMASILVYKLTNPRIVNEAAYRELVDRLVEKEIVDIISESDKETLKAIEQQARQTKDMAAMLLKAYK